MYTLLIHADRPAELKEIEYDAARIRYADVDDNGDWLTYESIGRIEVDMTPYDQRDTEPSVYAEVRSFIHPDLLEKIKAEAPQREVLPDPY